MPTRKITDPKYPRPCIHPEHNPPNMQVFDPGVYEHTCPGCGQVQKFMVPLTYSLLLKSCPGAL